MDPGYPAFPTLAGVGCVLVLVPLPWHAEAWNSGTCYYMIWAFLASLNLMVNSIVWSNNALNPAPIWCDISTRIIIAASVGVPASSMCIMRRLYKIARCHTVAVTRAEKRNAVLIDSLICIIFPLVYLVMAYVVQGHRFNIFEGVGCYPAIYNTLPAYFLVQMWPVVIGSISAVYCVLSLYFLAHRRAKFQQFLSTTNSGITGSRYFRLMALAATELLFTIPFGIYEIYSNLADGPMEPWISWEDTHYNFSRVVQYPSVIWRSDPALVVPVEISRWLIISCPLVFFAFFGFAEEARRHYREAYVTVNGCIRTLLKLPTPPKSSFKPSPWSQATSLPQFVTNNHVGAWADSQTVTPLDEKFDVDNHNP